MIAWSRQLRVFAYPEPVDLRLGFNGLLGLVEGTLQMDGVGGDLFLFVNRRRTLSKVLMFDGTGLGLYTKRLTQGRFAELWFRHHAGAIELTSSELALFLEGSPYAGRQRLAPDAKKIRENLRA